VQEALGRVGIKIEIQKLPDAQLNTMQAEKKLAFYTDSGTAWLPATYYFFYLYFTRDSAGTSPTGRIRASPSFPTPRGSSGTAPPMRCSARR
jgi:ABC-type transport system substrate-binding protein